MAELPSFGLRGGGTWDVGQVDGNSCAGSGTLRGAGRRRRRRVARGHAGGARARASGRGPGAARGERSGIRAAGKGWRRGAAAARLRLQRRSGNHRQDASASGCAGSGGDHQRCLGGRLLALFGARRGQLLRAGRALRHAGPLAYGGEEPVDRQRGRQRLVQLPADSVLHEHAAATGCGWIPRARQPST